MLSQAHRRQIWLPPCTEGQCLGKDQVLNQVNAAFHLHGVSLLLKAEKILRLRSAMVRIVLVGRRNVQGRDAVQCGAVRCKAI